MRAGDLDPGREVYYTSGGTVLHLRTDCHNLRHSDSRVASSTAGAMWDEEPVCKRCSGEWSPDGVGERADAGPVGAALDRLDPSDVNLL